MVAHAEVLLLEAREQAAPAAELAGRTWRRAADRSVAHSVSSPQPGDLVFVYNGGGGSVGHVAIYAGGGYWYEAANPSAGVGYHRAWTTNVSYGRIL